MQDCGGDQVAGTVGDHRTATTLTIAKATRIPPRILHWMRWASLNHWKITSVSITPRMVSTINVTLTRPSEK